MKKITLFFVSILIVSIAFEANAQSQCLDQSFGNAGISIHSFGNDTILPKSIALQQDGKLVVAGTLIDSLNSDFIITRYHINGDVDSSFGNAGILRTDFGNNDSDRTMKLLIQNDGKLLIGGSTKIGQKYNFALLRFNSNGSADPLFGNNGKLNFSVDTNNNFLQDFVLKSNGKIVITGVSTNSPYNESLNWHLPIYEHFSYLIQLNSTGTFDISFGNMGIVSTNFGKEHALKKVKIQADNKIVLLGFIFAQLGPNTNNTDYLLARFDSIGNLDNTFANIGYTQLDYIYADYPRELIIQNDGKIILQGSSGDNANYPLFLRRFFSNGLIDASFYFNGFDYLTIPIGRQYDKCSTISFSNGNLINLGDTYYWYGSSNWLANFAILPLKVNGSIDSSSCSMGYLETNVDTINKEIHADAALQTDGKIIQLGSSAYNNITLIRYESTIVNSVNETIAKVENKVLIYPNPASSFMTIINGIGKVNIIDLTGKSVLQKQVPNDSETIDISALAQGCYFVISNSNNRVSSFKLIKK
jgi:uncharacterized delta-60 repeat protein